MNPISPLKTTQHDRVFAAFVTLLLSTLLLILSGCTTWQAPAEFDVSVLRSRAVTAEIKGVRLSAAVLSRDDSMRMFGADINKDEVQPIWIEVENNTSQTLWLLRTGTDPDIFSPLEVAWAYHSAFSSENNARLDDHFYSLSFESPIAPGSTRSGIIFTNPHREIRLLNVDLLGQGQLYPFTLFPLIPDDSQEKYAHALFERFKTQKSEDFQDTAAFRTKLEQLPCCATNADGTKSGEPLNLVIVGNFKDISAAMVRRGFRVKISEFDNSQHVYGRSPDAVLRKSGQGGVPANWIRLWLAPFRYQGDVVFLAQVGRPVGGRFKQAEELKPILHPNVDEVRNLLIGDMMYSGGLGKLAFITGVGEAKRDKPRSALAGSKYYTDGIRTVMFFVTRPRAISEVEILDWYPLIKLYERETARGNKNYQN
jgi:hypothetical protein